MKKLLFIIFLLIPIVAYGASDRIISDRDAHVVDITAGGSLLSAGRTLVMGQQTIEVVGTAEALASSTDTPLVALVVKPLDANLNAVYLGSATVTSANGFEVSTGVVAEIRVDNLADVYINGKSVGDGISYVGFAQ